jgi:hypothetical protein
MVASGSYKVNKIIIRLPFEWRSEGKLLTGDGLQSLTLHLKPDEIEDPGSHLRNLGHPPLWIDIVGRLESGNSQRGTTLVQVNASHRAVMRLVILMLLVSIVACGQAWAQSNASCYLPDAQPQYFPAGVFGGNSKFSDLFARGSAQVLRSFEEPSLMNGTSDGQSAIYRFVLLPSLRKTTFMIRLSVNPNGTGILSSKIGQNERNGPNHIKTVTRSMSAEQVSKFLKLLEESNFWNLLTTDQRRGLDGNDWLLEGAEPSKYHVVDRWSPARRDSYTRACRFLIDASHLSVGRLD